MADVVAVRKAVSDLLGKKGDETIREYIMAVLELGDYDFGRNGELAYEHFGQMLVRMTPLEPGLVHMKIGWPAATFSWPIASTRGDHRCMQLE